MTNEPEWRDANPKIGNLPDKGKIIILMIAGGIALGVLIFVSMVIKPIGLAVGGIAFINGIIMLVRRRQLNYKPGLILTACGFLFLLSHPRFGPVVGIAGMILVIGAVGLVVFGLFKAVKLAWDVGRSSQ